MAVGVERGLGLVNFAMTVHFDHPDPMFEDNSSENVEKWAANIPVPTYAIDDQSAIKVTGSDVEVISEGNWRLFTPSTSTVQGTEQ
jgi:dipeptidase E